VQRTPHDYGNSYVQARADRFRMFGGDVSKGFEFTCAGRLMLVGAFDGLDQEPSAYLSALLDYQNAYWGNFGGGPMVASYERSDRSHDHRWDDPRGEYFKTIDQRLRDCGLQTRRAVHMVTVDRHWFPDEDVSWASRIINSAFLRKSLPVAGEIACDSDWAMLSLLRDGAIALVGQPLRRAA
jgi:hypothetical protein